MLSPDANHLLATLPAHTYERLRPALELVRLPLGSVVLRPGARIRHVYFPVEGIVSLVSSTRAGKSTELAVIGREGMVGASLFLGGEMSSNQAVVQSAAGLFRLPAATLQDGFAEGGVFQVILLRFAQSLFTQISQTAVCNRHHSLEQRLCRWLLLSFDRLPGNRIHITHELLAGMLGVRRQAVTEVAGRLLARGALLYSRGQVTILDRSLLEAQACECYAVVKEETARLLTDVTPDHTSRAASARRAPGAE